LPKRVSVLAALTIGAAIGFSALCWQARSEARGPDGAGKAAGVKEDVILPEWGRRWQPVLPARERHPFLFFDETDRERMRQRIHRPPFSLWWEGLHQHPVRSTPAFLWWLTGDEAAARACRDDLANNPIWRQQPQGYLEPSSHHLGDAVAAYDILAAWKGLDAASANAIRRRIADEADHYYEALATVDGGRNYGNQRVLAASALGLAALALCEYKESRHTPQEWLTRALHEIRRDENFWFFRPGGLFVEGVGYTAYMNVQFVQFAIAYERASGQYLFDDPRLKEWLAFAAYQTQPNGAVIPWGTCETQDKLDFFVPLANWRYGRSQTALFHHIANTGAMSDIHPYHAHIAIAQYDPEASGPMPPPSRAFPASQTVVLKSGWGHASVGVWFAGKDGTWPYPRFYPTYSQGDCGHFVLVAWDEALAADSGYDHWQSRDYYGPEFHNVPLIDGQGPTAETFGTLSNMVTKGAVQHATMTAHYQGCTWRRTLALVRGRYVVIADRFVTDREHDYRWQVRSTCPPDLPGTKLETRAVTWSGLSPEGWRDLKAGETELTTIVPPFARLSLEKGRWRPMSHRPEFVNQVAVAQWRAASTTALFALLPNRKAQRDLTWEAGEGQNLRIRGPGWTDAVRIEGDQLVIASSESRQSVKIRL